MTLCRRSTFVAAALQALWLPVSAVQAAYVDLTAEKHTTVSVGGIDRDVYRIYANFTDPLDRLHAVFGSAADGDLVLQNRNFDDTAFGSGFVSTGIGADAPSQEQIALNPDLVWDTFYTIGISIADQGPYGDQTSSFGWSAIPAGATEHIETNGTWYVLPTINHDDDHLTPEILQPQAQAGFLGDGDNLLRVMFLQLTVNAGENVRGTVNLSVHLNGDADGFNIGQQTFNSIPTPPAMAMLALAAGMLNGRRRRT